MDLLTNASLLQDSIKFVTENKQNLSNKKENIKQSDIQRFADFKKWYLPYPRPIHTFTHSQ